MMSTASASRKRQRSRSGTRRRHQPGRPATASSHSAAEGLYVTWSCCKQQQTQGNTLSLAAICCCGANGVAGPRASINQVWSVHAVRVGPIIRWRRILIAMRQQSSVRVSRTHAKLGRDRNAAFVDDRSHLRTPSAKFDQRPAVHSSMLSGWSLTYIVPSPNWNSP